MLARLYFALVRIVQDRVRSLSTGDFDALLHWLTATESIVAAQDDVPLLGGTAGYGSKSVWRVSNCCAVSLSTCLDYSHSAPDMFGKSFLLKTHCARHFGRVPHR